MKGSDEIATQRNSLAAFSISIRNAFDQARTGSLWIKSKFVTEILVDKKDAEMAMHIVRTMM